MGARRVFIVGFLAAVACSFALTPFLGQNFFPPVEGSQIKLHLRAPTGTRIEETARLCDRVERAIRATIPGDALGPIVDNIGLPLSGINSAYNNSGTVGPGDADILITLNPGHGGDSDAYVRALRETLPRLFPGASFAFLPADIVSQILNFGLPSPIDVQIIGPDQNKDRVYADALLKRIARVNGVADARIQQAFNNPTLNVKVDRVQAGLIGLSEGDVAKSLQDSLSGSFKLAPTFWINPKNGVAYQIVAQTPQYWLNSASNLENIPASQGDASQILGGVAKFSRTASPSVVSHYAVQPVIDVFATNNQRDLGAVSADIRQIIAETARDAPPGSTIVLRGQTATMTSAFSQLYTGLALAIVLIYLLIVVNFQSWLDPFVIISALPTALAGIVWTLFITRTTLSVPALTGAIMCMGVATANSILVVSFARERLADGADALAAALDAGVTRFRPVLMTALAMIIGMAPMALSAEQNAPLGRAVIGGLICSTVATLFFVPAVFRLVHAQKSAKPANSSSILHTHAESDMSGPTSDPNDEGAPARPPMKIGRYIVLFVLIALGVATTGIASRRSDASKLARWTYERAIPNVAVVAPTRGGGVRELVLPGDVEAFYNATVHAQVSGYVKQWTKDIGAHVKAGDVLATIDTPELDERLAQAGDELAKAKANQALAAVTAQRWNSLRASAAVSQQAADEKVSDAAAKDAEVAAATSNVQRLKALKAFANIVAPFDGVVTQRNVDIGTLVGPGTSAGSDLFAVADTHEMRVYVKVPQTYAAQLREGMKAALKLPRISGSRFRCDGGDDLACD